MKCGSMGSKCLVDLFASTVIRRDMVGATRFKKHLANRGNDVVQCNQVPTEVKKYFVRYLDKSKHKKDARNKEKLRREEAARPTKGQYVHDLTSDADEEDQLQAALAASRAEVEFRKHVDDRGGHYDHGGGSGTAEAPTVGWKGNPIMNMFRRSSSHREAAIVGDYNLAASKCPTQMRIDTGPWSRKGKLAKDTLGKTWAAFFQSSGIAGRNADNPYFKSTIKGTQKLAQWWTMYEQAGGYTARDDEDVDPFDRLMELSLYDHDTTSNPIREWMDTTRSTSAPELDEEDTQSDTPMPSRLVTNHIDPQDLHAATGTDSIVDWSERFIGDTHLGKRKARKCPNKKGKKATCKGWSKSVGSDDSTQGSPSYQESNDSSSKTNTDDGDDGGATQFIGGHTTYSRGHGPIVFTGEENFTHATQDEDHGAPNSQRRTTPDTTQQQSSWYEVPQSSSSLCSSTTLHGSSESFDYTYPLPEANEQPATHWIYEWKDREFYTMLYHEWQTTAAWTHQTWHDYKATLLSTHGLMLMSIGEYNMANHGW